MLANVNELASSFIAALVFDVQEAPFLGRTSVIGAGKQPTAAEFRRRWRTFPLPTQSFKKIVKQPIWNGISLARIDPTKREQMTKQYLPMWVHVHDQALPIDCLSLLKNEMDDIDAIMTVPLLDERLCPDQLGGVDHRHAMPEHLSLCCILKPLFLNRHGAIAGTKDDVNEIATAVNFSQPTLIRRYPIVPL
jgi:hypothetical protein